MDATFGTNNAGMDLFAILAELDGTGIPLAYCFVQTISVEDTRHSGPGALTAILDQFLRVLKSEGLDPAFFGVDKDFSEIAAVKQVFPSAKVQLCFWHAKRAIQQKMRDASKTKTQAKYFPAEAQAIVPSLEICWDRCRLVDHKATTFSDDVSVHREAKDLTKQAGWKRQLRRKENLF